MRYFPISVIDNFFTYPHAVLEISKNVNYSSPAETNYPGIISSELDSDITNWVASKILHVFYNFKNTYLEWNATATFQKITPYKNENQYHILNRGIPHTDSNCGQLAGVIFLDLNPSKDSGTSFYQKKKGSEFYQRSQKFLESSRKYHSGVTLDTYEDMLSEHLNAFEETVRIQSKFNRLLIYSTDVWHSQTTYGINDERLTFRIFLDINCKEETLPLQRFNE